MDDAGQTWLLLDASGVVTRVGLWKAGRWRAYREQAAPALEALFAGARAALAEAGVGWREIGGYIYVEGPGSVLGLRLAAMAIRAWQVEDAAAGAAQNFQAGPADGAGRFLAGARPLRCCGSLHLAAALAWAGGAVAPFAVCTEARQGAWHVLEIVDDDRAKLAAARVREVDDAGLAEVVGALFHVPARKNWRAPPPHAQKVPGALGEHPEVLAWPGVLRAEPTPIPVTGAVPGYRKWTAGPLPA